MKKIILALLTFMIFAGFSPAYKVQAATAISVICDGKTISSDSLYCTMKNDTIMIPYKLLDKATGVSTGWKSSKKRLTVKRNNIVLIMYKGKKQLVKNNEFNYTLSEKMIFRTINGANCACVPAKKICQLLGFKYSYNSSTKTITLTARQPISNYSSTSTAKAFLLMNTKQFVEAIGPIAQKNYHKSGVLASVTIAQAIEESWSGTSYLAQKGNNLFGMKTSLSGNNWKGSAWKGKKVIKKTHEQYGSKVVTIKAAFRKYDNVAQSISDHSSYLKNAKKDNGSRRYKGLTSTKSYSKQLSIIQKGGYCTFKNYSKNLKKIIKKYNLTRFDK